MSFIVSPQNFRFEFMNPHDARLGAILKELVRCQQRYGGLEGYDAWGAIRKEMNEQLTKEHGGVFLAMFEGNTIVATGAARRWDEETAEFTKLWSHPVRRGQGLATMLLVRLETEARRMGYRKVYVTGPRYHEADRLYRRNGFTAHYDLRSATPRAYTKALVHGVDGTKLSAQSTSSRA